MRSIYFFLLLFISIEINAQEFGGNTPSTKWRQINTDTVRVVYPEGMEKSAKQVAEWVHVLQAKDLSSLGGKTRKISLVFQNQNTFSNAYVGLAPWRSEFYNTAPQDPFILGATDWNKNLAIHEYRHVQQYSNFNKGFSQFASILLGQQGQALANAAAIPDWFFEGDAVYNETLYSNQGRGRLPLFQAGFQSLLLANKKYNYQQLRNGSLRFYTPNHYSLGYLLVAYGRKMYGNDIWQKITSDAAAYKPFFYPFQNAIKKHTGKKFEQFYQDAMGFYQAQWKQPLDSSVQWITALEKNNVTDYLYPYPTASGATLVLKKSYKKIPAFYLIQPDGKEQIIATKQIAVDDQYSYNNGRLVYAAYQPDARWGNRDFNQLVLLDIATGNTEIIAAKSRYFSPDIAHDGKTLAVIESKTTGESVLTTLNREGAVLEQFEQKDWVLASPKFSKNNHHLFFTARNPLGQMALLKKAIGSNEPIEILLPFSNSLLGYLLVQGDALTFTKTVNGRDELWTMNVADSLHQPFKLATYPTGLYQGFLKGQMVQATVFTANGYRLGLFNPKWELGKPNQDELKTLELDNLYQSANHLGWSKSQNDSLVARSFTTSPYKKSYQLFNLHSWRPMYSDPEYSFSIYGENVLNTVQSQLAYTYNENEGSHKLGFEGVYGGSYLQPILGLDQTWSRTARLNNDTVLHWNETEAQIGLRLPLNLSGGNAYRALSFQSSFNLELVRWTGLGQKLLKDQDFQSWNNQIRYQSQIQKSKQQIFSHWGQSLLADFKTNINGYQAQQLLISGSFFLPGVSNNHSLVLSAAYQARDTMQQYLFSNNFPFSRGYEAINFPRMWKLSANYHLPICYPEWGFGQIVYFQRIRANLFFDHTIGKSLRTGSQFQFNSTGLEVFFDTRWWNQQPISFGIRYSRLLSQEFRVVPQPNVWELVLPVSLF
jgi:hypothetical protein